MKDKDNILSYSDTNTACFSDVADSEFVFSNPVNNDIYMFEVKSYDEIHKYIDINNEKRIKQLLSYSMQEKSTKIISFYTYNFEEEKDYFYNKKHQTVDIIKLNGSVELGPLVELSDVIVDIVETGSTLRENGLEVLEEICNLSAKGF